jgi:hypothetical protein
MKFLSDILLKAGIIQESSSAYSTGGYSLLVRNSTSGRFETISSEALLPSQAGNAGRFLKTNGTTSSWSNILVADVTGAVSGLTGEVTTTGTGVLSVTVSNLAVINKVLTGLSVTSGSLVQTDSILTAFGKLQGQINALSGGSTYKGTWNAATNTPTITSSVGTSGHYYIVGTAGTTSINGINAWDVGDWIIFDGSVWQKVDNTDSVTSVNGLTGAINLTTTNITEATNLYYTDARARAAISLTTTGSSGAATYSAGVLNIPNYTLAGLGGVSGSGAAGQISYWSGATAQAGNNNLFWDAATNRLGVNINTPTTALHVVGNGFINGRLGVGTSTLTSHGLHVGANISGAAISFGVLQSGTVQTDVSTLALGFENQVNIASGFAANAYHHFRAVQNTFGVGATLAFQAGFFVTSTLTGATNNYGFYGNMPSGAGSWNLFMAGAGNNYMAGNLLLGNSSDTTEKLQVTGTAKITGATSIGGALSVTGAISAGSGPSEFAGSIRVTNATVPTTGIGLEIQYVTGSSSGFITSINRSGVATYTTLTLNGSTLNLNTGSNGAVNFGTGNIVSTSGKFRLGTTPGTTGYINIGINNTTGSQFNLATSSFIPSSPVNGDGWFDGTNLNFRIDGSTTKFITGSLTSGYVPKATGSGAIDDSLVYDNGTSVLVNTATVIGGYTHSFQVAANAAGGMIILTDDDSSAIGIVNSAAANKTWDITPFGSDLVINESGISPRMKFKAGGNIEVSSLAGTGSRMVVADAAGVMSTQAIPTGSITGSGASTYVALWNGTSSLTGHFSLAYSVGNSLRLANVISPTTLSAIGFNVESGISGMSGAQKLIGINVEPTYSTIQGSVGPLDTDAIGVNVSTNFVRDSTDLRYTSININPTINQTVTASGVTRGIRVNPTITAAPDWRSIEWNNNSGWGLYGAGTANNYLGGNLGIAITPTSRLHVSGSGSNGTTSSLTVENSSASVGLRVLDSGDVYAGDGGWFRVQGASKRYIYKTDATDGIFSISSCSSLGTTFNMYGATHATKPKTIQIGATYAPTSGSITYNTLEFRPTITQTGTANAITRGLYIDPLLSNTLSGDNWRSIEWSNNSGWGLYGVGTASNHLAGSLSIGTAATNKLLSVSGNVILGGTTTHLNDSTNAITLSGIVSFATGDIRVNGTNVVSASSTSWTFYSGVALTSNGITGYSSLDFDVSSGATTRAVNLRVSTNTYLKVAPTTGNILIQNAGTFTDNLTDRLQVVGSSSFTGNGVFNGKLTASNSVPTTGFPTTNTIALFGAQTLNIPAATIGASGVVYAAGTSANYMRFNGNTTMVGDALFAGKVVINSVQFDTTGTVTMSDSLTNGIRALSSLQVQMQAAGAISGTVSKGASILVQGVYPNNTAGAVTFTDYFGIRINNLLEWDTGTTAGRIAMTNKWGIFQAGANDKNFFNGAVQIGTSAATGSKLKIAGLPTSAAGLTAGDVWVNGNVLTIV